MMAYLNQVGATEFQKWKERCIAKIGESYKTPAQFEYRMYHNLIGGSGHQEKPFFDFSGDLSVQKMIEDLPLKDEKE